MIFSLFIVEYSGQSANCSNNYAASSQLLVSMTDEELFARRGRLSYELDQVDRELARRGSCKLFFRF